MNKFDFNIGATVHCKNGKFGKLQKLVVDPKSMEITDLVVGKRFLRTEERIVPVSVVDCANDEYVMLSINDTEIENYPEYVEYISNSGIEAESKSKQKNFDTAYVAHPYVFGPTSRYIPILHRQIVRTNVHPDHEVVEHGTPVHNQKNRIGSVDHMFMDEKSGKLTHIVVDPGFFSNSVVVPIALAERVDGEGIIINLDEEDINQFPEYGKLDNVSE